MEHLRSRSDGKLQNDDTFCRENEDQPSAQRATLTKSSGCIKVKLFSSSEKTEQKAQVEIECDNPALVLDRMLNSLISKFPNTSVASIKNMPQTVDVDVEGIPVLNDNKQSIASPESMPSNHPPSRNTFVTKMTCETKEKAHQLPSHTFLQSCCASHTHKENSDNDTTENLRSPCIGFSKNTSISGNKHLESERESHSVSTHDNPRNRLENDCTENEQCSSNVIYVNKNYIVNNSADISIPQYLMKAPANDLNIPKMLGSPLSCQSSSSKAELPMNSTPLISSPLVTSPRQSAQSSSNHMGTASSKKSCFSSSFGPTCFFPSSLFSSKSKTSTSLGPFLPKSLKTVESQQFLSHPMLFFPSSHVSEDNKKIIQSLSEQELQCYKHLLCAQHQAIIHLTPHQQAALLNLTPLQYYCVSKILTTQQQSFAGVSMSYSSTPSCLLPFLCLSTSSLSTTMPTQIIEDYPCFQELTAVQHYVSVQMQTSRHFQENPHWFLSEKARKYFEHLDLKYSTGDKIDEIHNFAMNNETEKRIITDNTDEHAKIGESRLNLILKYIYFLTNFQNELSSNYFSERQRNELRNMSVLQQQALWQLMSAQQQAIAVMPRYPFFVFTSISPNKFHSMTFLQISSHFQTLRSLAGHPSSKLAMHLRHEFLLKQGKKVNSTNQCLQYIGPLVQSSTLIKHEEMKEIIKAVPKIDVVELEKKTVKYIPKVTKRVVEQIVEVPSKETKVLIPKAVPVDTAFVIPKFQDKEVPVIMSETLIPEIRQDEQILEVPVAKYTPVIVPVDVYVPKPVIFPIKPTKPRQQFLPANNVDNHTFQRMLYQMNPHLRDLDVFNSHQGTIFSNLIEASREQAYKCEASSPQPVSVPIVTIEDLKKHGISSINPFSFSMGGFQESNIREYFNFLMEKRSTSVSDGERNSNNSGVTKTVASIR